MRNRTAFYIAIAVVAAATLAVAKKKEPLQRGMLVKMDSSGCGTHEKGVSGVGSIMASAGVTRVTTEDKLCAEYVLRTDTMEYHIRPTEKKDPALLPVGHESLFRVADGHMFLRMADEDTKRMREYQVISMKPLEADARPDSDKPRDRDDGDSHSSCH